MLSGPMFEPARREGAWSVSNKQGAHYNIYYLDANAAGKHDAEVGMTTLRELFPNGEADEYNLCLFSTSGIHGTYFTIEQIEECLLKYGNDGPADDDEQDDWIGNQLTVLVVQPRIVCLRCGTVRVRLTDVGWLKHLRETSWQEFAKIGAWPATVACHERTTPDDR